MSNKPTHRIRYTEKATKKKWDCGVVWAPRSPMDGLLGSLAPQKTNEEGQYPKMRLIDAIERWERGEGFLDCWSTDRPQKKPQSGGDYGGGDFGDVPFCPVDDRLI